MSSESAREYWIEARENGQRAVDFANRMLGIDTPEDIAEASIALAGADSVLGDRHRLYEEEFNALIKHEIKTGRVTQDIGEAAMSSFHVYMTGNRCPQTSPRFYQ